MKSMAPRLVAFVAIIVGSLAYATAQPAPPESPVETAPPVDAGVPVAEPPAGATVDTAPVDAVDTAPVAPTRVEPTDDTAGEALPPLPPLPPSGAIADRATTRNFAGSVQLDYLTLTRKTTPDEVFAGPTVELSLKLAMDLGHGVTANVKVCYACHGFEVGMAYFDVRFADELAVRVGRFTPAFGSFPVRHDPANHSTSDKPLMYDMGRMVRFREWNEGILPTPWVDNGVEVSGTHELGDVAQLDYAVYAMAGPKGSAQDFDFDFVQSRSPESYYIDNNNVPMAGARVALSIDLATRRTLTVGGSAMGGHYDAAAELRFGILGADATLQIDRTFVRAEYLARWTEFALGEDPDSRLKFGPGSDGTYSDFFFKDGFDLEVEHPIGRVSVIGRFDGLRRRGNVLVGGALSNDSRILRGTVGIAVRLVSTVQLKTSYERYQFDDFRDENALHLGIAGQL
jgi:hypothetical protein